uniref:Uncharacterized protein n=1 Tax=Rhabditophanes sp. KR3021 TaxID=114890 RepID=A0AC35TXP9_9BILA
MEEEVINRYSSVFGDGERAEDSTEEDSGKEVGDFWDDLTTKSSGNKSNIQNEFQKYRFLALFYLSSPPTSVDSERNRLKPETIENIMMIEANELEVSLDKRSLGNASKITKPNDEDTSEPEVTFIGASNNMEPAVQRTKKRDLQSMILISKLVIQPLFAKLMIVGNLLAQKMEPTL